MKLLKSGEIGERQAEQWFLNNGWNMVRTQPAMQILDAAPGKRYGIIFTCRMVGRGGVPDYTGYEYVQAVPGLQTMEGEGALYRAVEVKEASGDTMPCSRLDKAQRAFMAALPAGCAWVGIYWTDTAKFTMHEYKRKGS